jgi:AbrB family looped-hinge helix DNA binding protein
MNLARISQGGQVTLPLSIRRALRLRDGDKLQFLQRANGEIVIDNASVSAIMQAQEAFEGAASDFGLENDDDVQRMVNEMRYRKEQTI